MTFDEWWGHSSGLVEELPAKEAGRAIWLASANVERKRCRNLCWAVAASIEECARGKAKVVGKTVANNIANLIDPNESW